MFTYMFVQVGESNRPSFRPGLEGGSSDDEASSGRGGPSLSGIEHRRSAEGQVINAPVTGAICSLNDCPSLPYFFLFLFSSLAGFLTFLIFRHECILRIDTCFLQGAVSW